MWSIFFIFFGIGVLLGLLYVIVKFLPLMVHVIIGGAIDVLATWWKAAKDGFISGYNKK